MSKASVANADAQNTNACDSRPASHGTPQGDALAVIRQAWVAECAKAEFRIRDESCECVIAVSATSSCPHPHEPIAAGTDARGWTRYVCCACERFYGFAPPDVGADKKQANTRR